MEEIYHIVTKSIAEYKIFNNDKDSDRMKDVIRYYQCTKQPISYSSLDKLSQEKATCFRNHANDASCEKLVKIIAYCLMPTHIHLIVQQLRENGMSRFMSNVLNSYSRYFNLKHKRKGPLWQGRFKKVLVENQEQLLHLTRYIHLNPVTAYLVDHPEDWLATSYHEYIQTVRRDDCFCEHHSLLDMSVKAYKQFVEERIVAQRDLATIKHLLVDEPI